MSRHQPYTIVLVITLIVVASIATPRLAEACSTGHGHQAHLSKTKKKVKVARHLPSKKTAKRNRVVDPIFENEANETIMATSSDLIENEVATDLSKGKSTSSRHHVDAVDYFDQQAQVNEEL